MTRALFHGRQFAPRFETAKGTTPKIKRNHSVNGGWKGASTPHPIGTDRQFRTFPELAGSTGRSDQMSDSGQKADLALRANEVGSYANEQLGAIGDARAIGGRDASDMLVKALHDPDLSDGSAS